MATSDEIKTPDSKSLDIAIKHDSSDVVASSKTPSDSARKDGVKDDGKFCFKLDPVTISSTEATLQWKFPHEIAKLTLIGRSRAADATGFYIPELCFALDAGAVACDQFGYHIFITHTHTDHVHMVLCCSSVQIFSS